MPNAYALTLTRPQEALGFRQPLTRRFPRGIVAWNAMILLVTFLCVFSYVALVNTATSKSYALRRTEQRVEQLKTETMLLRDKIATISTLQSLQDRARELGFVPMDRLEFLSPASSLMAKR